MLSLLLQIGVTQTNGIVSGNLILLFIAEHGFVVEAYKQTFMQT